MQCTAISLTESNWKQRLRLRSRPGCISCFWKRAHERHPKHQYVLSRKLICISPRSSICSTRHLSFPGLRRERTRLCQNDSGCFLSTKSGESRGRPNRRRLPWHCGRSCTGSLHCNLHRHSTKKNRSAVSSLVCLHGLKRRRECDLSILRPVEPKLLGSKLHFAATRSREKHLRCLERGITSSSSQ
jgi:hypothetical protein